jgi:uncharacterized membrane protein AbrB (regulator of aidB expression)
MFDVLELFLVPGLAVGLIAGGGLAYLLGVREPFIIGSVAVLGGLLGLVFLDLGIPKSKARRRSGG